MVAVNDSGVNNHADFSESPIGENVSVQMIREMIEQCENIRPEIKNFVFTVINILVNSKGFCDIFFLRGQDKKILAFFPELEKAKSTAIAISALLSAPVEIAGFRIYDNI